MKKISIAELIIMKNKFHWLWEKGFLYIIIASILFCVYGLNERVGIFDWQKEIAYLQYIKTSLTTYHSLPYFWWNKLDSVAWFPGISHTSNFFSNPETLLFSPLTVLLLFMDVIHYIKLLSIIHFLVGVIGLFMLRRRLHWNNIQFRTYSSLFLFSPIIIQHLSIGYTPWLNIFFFPWLVYFIADRKPFSNIIGTSIILSLVLFQGGVHIFLWFVMFLILYFISNAYLERNWRYLIRLISILILTPLLSFVRIYTTAQTFGNFHQAFQIGYNPINFLFWALIPPVFTPLIEKIFIRKIWFGVPSWDGGIFWGLSVLMIVVAAKNYKSYRNSENTATNGNRIALNYNSILISSSILFALSFFSIFETLIRAVNSIVYVPFSDGVEKYPFRLALPAFLGYSVMISHYSESIWETMSKWMDSRQGLREIFFSIANAMMYIALAFFSLAFLVSIALYRLILANIYEIVKETYSGTGSQWLSYFFMKGKNNLPLEDYMAIVETKYFQLQLSLFVVLVFLLIVFLALRNRDLIMASLKNFPYVAYEFTLTIPLLFSSVMWIGMAISVPFSNFQVQDVLPPKIITQPAHVNLHPEMVVTPQKLIIYPREGSEITEYILPEIPFSDSKFLDIESNNAIKSESNGTLSILPQDTGPIILMFNSTKNYIRATALTVAVWLGVISICLVKRSVAKKKIKDII